MNSDKTSGLVVNAVGVVDDDTRDSVESGSFMNVTYGVRTFDMWGTPWLNDVIAGVVSDAQGPSE